MLFERIASLGYLEGESIAIGYRSADGKADHIPGLVADLVQLKVDVLIQATILRSASPSRRQKQLPIVIVIDWAPVAAGLFDSLAHPSGNITEISGLTRGFNGKRLELLTEVVPGIGRLPVLWGVSSEGSRIGLRGTRPQPSHLSCNSNP